MKYDNVTVYRKDEKQTELLSKETINVNVIVAIIAMDMITSARTMIKMIIIMSITKVIIMMIIIVIIFNIIINNNNNNNISNNNNNNQ